MSNDELLKQWQQAVAEFGERACERFTHKGMAFYDENVTSNAFAEEMLKLNNLKIKSVSELFQHDNEIPTKGEIMNSELKQRLIAALESAIENSNELKSLAYHNCDSARYERMVAMYQSEITEYQDLINELQNNI